jgi:hypothetical protein
MMIQEAGTRPHWREIFQNPKSQWQARDEFNRICAEALTRDLRACRFRGALRGGEVGLMCVLRNEAARLPLFFEHYRKLGVDRFFMVDNGSTDGSADLLLAEPQADVFTTDASYFGSYYGIYWYNAIARACGRGHWLLMADADELLVYDGMDGHDIKAFAAWLDSEGCDRVHAPMIDLYVSGVIGKRRRSVAEALAEDCWFDTTGYRTSRWPAGWILTGGPRERLFNTGAEKYPHWISKYPFFRMKEETVLFDAHFLWPWDSRYRGPEAALLHLKMLDDFIERCAISERENQHVFNSAAYRLINQRLAEKPLLRAAYDGSRRYSGFESLVAEGMLLPLGWNAPANSRAGEALEFPSATWHGRVNWGYTLPVSGIVWKRRDEFNALSRRSLSAHLREVRCRGALAPGEIGAVCVVRNEVERLPLFFEHYKALGVNRFFMVDNLSDDGTHELLLEEPSADVFLARATFNEGAGGLYWANGIARDYCRNNWIVRPDADELLVYDGMERHGLAGLRDWLAARGMDRLYAMMLDVYPAGDLGVRKRSIRDVLTGDCWFDSEGYELTAGQGGWLLTGGPRHRLLRGDGEEPYTHWLSKYPFFQVTDETAIVDHHWLWPIDWTRRQPLGALLHLKLMDDFIERSAGFEREGQHAAESGAYRAMNREMARLGGVNFFHAKSRRYRGPQSLLRYRVMGAIDWST